MILLCNVISCHPLSLIHSFRKYLLTTSCVPDTVLGNVDVVIHMDSMKPVEPSRHWGMYTPEEVINLTVGIVTQELMPKSATWTLSAVWVSLYHEFRDHPTAYMIQERGWEKIYFSRSWLIWIEEALIYMCIHVQTHIYTSLFPSLLSSFTAPLIFCFGVWQIQVQVQVSLCRLPISLAWATFT